MVMGIITTDTPILTKNNLYQPVHYVPAYLFFSVKFIIPLLIIILLPNFYIERKS